jgi:hypothetical protein
LLLTTTRRSLTVLTIAGTLAAVVAPTASAEKYVQLDPAIAAAIRNHSGPLDPAIAAAIRRHSAARAHVAVRTVHGFTSRDVGTQVAAFAVLLLVAAGATTLILHRGRGRLARV